MGFSSAPAFALQQDPPPQPQVPAPVVHARPRAQTSVPVNAPPDAAPLVTHAPRPRPINPQDLGGTGTSASTTPVTRPRPAQTAPAAGVTGSTSATVRPHAAQTTPVVPRTVTAPSASTGVAPVNRAAQPTPAIKATAGNSAAASSTPPKPAFTTTGINRTIIVLDPAHGGPDSGSRIGDNTLEKNVTLAFAFRLRSLLLARGFTVVLTRDSDSATEPSSPNGPLTLDDRAGIANHMRPAACLLLHATGRGDGVHLYSSDLEAATGETPDMPWLTAQAAWIPASLQLERSISSALNRSHISLVSNTASIRPVDSLTCPALVLELAPESSDVRSVNDAGYQERVAAAVAGALVFWENQVQPPPKLSLSPSTPHTARHHAQPAHTTTEGQP